MSDQKTAQSFTNHARFVTGYHFVLAGVSLITLGAAIYYLVTRWGSENALLSWILLGLTLALAINVYYTRTFALKAQDRAIRAEQHLRHFALTGRLPDGKLTTRQAIGLRFADDQEFVELVNRAIEEGLSEKAIKKSIKVWRSDVYRV